MRIVVTWAATGGGVARIMTALTRGLARAGHELVVVLPQRQGHQPDELAGELVEIGSRAPHKVIAGLARAIRRHRPAALLSAQQQMNVAAMLAVRAANPRPRTMVVQHNQLSALVAGDPRLRFMPMLARWLYPGADEIVAVSHGVADDLARLLGLVRDRIRVIYNGLDLEEVSRLATCDPPDTWLELAHTPMVLACGRLAPQKDYDTLVRAMALVQQQRPAQLVILGGGTDRDLEALQGSARKLGASMTLVGHVQNPYAYMTRAACLAMSSRWEGLPTVLIEALACGCPIVSTDCPSGPREILEGGQYGSLVPVGDHEALAQAIEAVLETPPDRDALKRRAVAFSQEVMIGRYLELIEGGSAQAKGPA